MESNKKRGEDALKQLEREINARDRKEKAKPWTVALLALAVIALIGGGIYFAATWESDEEVVASDTTTEEQPPIDAVALKRERSQPLEPTVSCSYREDGEGEFYKGLPEMENVSTEGEVEITLDTNQGPIGLTLDRSVSPCSVNAIEYLAEEKYYDNTVCHRLTTDGIHVLQCGDPKGDGTGGPGFRFDNEYPSDDEQEKQNQQVKYERGTIALANAGLDPNGQGTNGSQFFLNYKDSPLTPDYTYIGVINEEGLATLEKIAANGIKADESMPDMPMTDGEPKDEVKINSATVSKK